MLALLLVGVSDELSAGVPVAGAPGVAGDLGLGAGVAVFATVLSAPMGLGLLLEPAIHVWSDRVDRRWLYRAALAGAAGALVGAAVAPHAAVLALALGVWGLCTGVACGLAQTGLVTAGPDATRALTRWALATSVGDLAAPLVVGGLAWIGLGWRAATLVAAAATLAALAGSWGARFDADDDDGNTHGDAAAPEDDEDDEVPVLEAVRAALRDRRLLAWGAALAACSLLDELLLMVAALRAGGDPAATNGQLGALVAGDLVGLLVVERALRDAPPRAVLVASSALAALGLGAWLVTDDVALGAAALFVVGAAAVLHWPLVKARALACAPGRPGLVHGLESALGAVDVVLPVAVGAAIAGSGVPAAVAVLALQPAIVAVVAATASAPPGPSPRAADGGDRGERRAP